MKLLIILVNMVNCTFFCLYTSLQTGHIGSNDAELSSQHLNVLQSQMQSKGGYDYNSLRIQVCVVVALLMMISLTHTQALAV